MNLSLCSVKQLQEMYKCTNLMFSARSEKFATARFASHLVSKSLDTRLKSEIRSHFALHNKPHTHLDSKNLSLEPTEFCYEG